LPDNLGGDHRRIRDGIMVARGESSASSSLGGGSGSDRAKARGR
jgi:hypothetical protein